MKSGSLQDGVKVKVTDTTTSIKCIYRMRTICNAQCSWSGCQMEYNWFEFLKANDLTPSKVIRFDAVAMWRRIGRWSQESQHAYRCEHGRPRRWRYEYTHFTQAAYTFHKLITRKIVKTRGKQYVERPSIRHMQSIWISQFNLLVNCVCHIPTDLRTFFLFFAFFFFLFCFRFACSEQSRSFSNFLSSFLCFFFLFFLISMKNSHNFSWPRRFEYVKIDLWE